VTSRRRDATVEKIGGVGCGLMGSGIVEVYARAGLDVVVAESSRAAVTAGVGRLEKSLTRAESPGKLESAAGVLERIHVVADLDTKAVAESPQEEFKEPLYAPPPCWRGRSTRACSAARAGEESTPMPEGREPPIPAGCASGQSDAPVEARRGKVRWKVVVAAETPWAGSVYETRAGHRWEGFEGPEEFMQAVMRLTGWRLTNGS
jgi:hypothetical protein